MSRDPVPDDHTSVVWNDSLGHEASVPRGLAAMGTRPNQVVLDTAGENLHDIFLDPLELNSVETEVTAAESPWLAGITEADGRAFKLVIK